MEILNLKPIEQVKISNVAKLIVRISAEDVVYHEADSYQSLLSTM